MLAVEFNSIIDDGIIRIPEEFAKQVGHKVRVILLTDNNEIKDVKPKFSALSLNTKDFKFSREEANER